MEARPWRALQYATHVVTDERGISTVRGSRSRWVQSSRLQIILLSAALAAATLPSRATGIDQPDTSVGAVVMAAASYLREYKNQLSYLLADERYSQRVFGVKGRERARRDMLGELFVTLVPGEQFWLSVHDISEVDGEPVMDREDLRRLLERDTMTNVARALMERNARFNLGTVSRNFNEPTLALRLLEADRRRAMKFSRKNVTREDGTTIVTIGSRRPKRRRLSGPRPDATFSRQAKSISKRAPGVSTGRRCRRSTTASPPSSRPCTRRNRSCTCGCRSGSGTLLAGRWNGRSNSVRGGVHGLSAFARPECGFDKCRTRRLTAPATPS